MNTIPRLNKPNAFKKGRPYASAFLVMLITLACSISTNLFSQNSQPTVSNSTLPGLIAYAGNDGNIYTIDQNGKQKTSITQDANLSPGSGQVGRIYQYPTWAPDGQRLAFMAFVGTDPTKSQASLYTAGSDGKNRVEAYTSQDTFPFYLFWSSNSEYVTFLSNEPAGNGLILQIAAAKGGDSKVIGTGQPYYWDWSSDNKTIIVHTGGAVSENPAARLALFELDGFKLKKELDIKPGLFQAPAWSPVGNEMVMATEDNPTGESLVLAGQDGNTKRVLAQFSGPVAFAWSPKGNNLAYMTSVPGDSTHLLKRLSLMDPSQPAKGKEVAQGPIVAYFWSPDSQKVAYFELGLKNPGQTSLIIPIAQSTPKIDVDVQVYDLASGVTRKAATFQPTDSFQQVFSFFDQYQRSATLWSPDSKNLVLAGLDNNGNSNIFVASIDGSKFQKIADGNLAFWSWK